MKLEQADLDAIADAVYQKLKAEAVDLGKKTTDAAAPAKPATKPKVEKPAPKPEAAPKATDAPALGRDDVHKALTDHAKRHTKEAAIAILKQYGESLGKVDPSKF